MAITAFILTQPEPDLIHQSIRPVVYSLVFSNGLPGDPVVTSALATVTVNGGNSATLRLKPFEVLDFGGGFFWYIFSFNFQQFAHDNLSFNFSDLDWPDDVDHPQWEALLEPVFQWESLDGNGHLQTDPVQYEFGATIVIDAVRQHRTERLDLVEFTISAQGQVAGWVVAKWLTNGPLIRNIRHGDSERLHYYNSAAFAVSQAVMITTYDNVGGVVGQYVKHILAGGLTGRKSHGVGPANILRSNWDFVLGPIPVLGPTVTSYDVRLGFLFANLVIPLYEIILYRLVTCKDATRVHFRNWLGGIESFLFIEISDEFETSSGTFTKALLEVDPYAMDGTDYGRSNIDSRARERRTFRTEVLSREEAFFFRELLLNNEVWIEQPHQDANDFRPSETLPWAINKRIPARVIASKTSTFDIEKTGIEYFITLEYANDHSIPERPGRYSATS